MPCIYYYHYYYYGYSHLEIVLFDCSEIVRKSGTMKDGRDIKYRIVLENSCSTYAVSGISGNICIYLFIFPQYFDPVCAGNSRVVAGNKNSPNVVHACRKRRLKWSPSVRGYSWTTLSPGNIKTEA